jgi:hypothetical protein
MKTLVALILLGAAATVPGRTPGPQGATQDIKDVGHDTAEAAKKTGSAVEKGTSKAAHESAHAAKKTGTAVGSASKEAGQDTAHAAEKTGSAVEDTTKKTAHKSSHAVKKGTAKLEGKPAPQ